MVEISFKPIKSELVWHKVFYTGAQGEQTIARHIDGFCNLVRRRPRSTTLGSGLVDQSQKMMVAARATAEKKAVG
ncbi:hypothetical protein QP731_04490, partial [Sphingomonas sp. UMB7805-LC452B]|nr:hypothetical protein [Sphingomonas zeae]MDK8214982.1 hypothetical protein [Sphingomonas sp. UMB7805-LC452B]